jgi:hypothetical protein
MSAGKISTSQFNLASTGVGADFLTADISPKLAASMAIDVTLDGAAILSVVEKVGGTTVVHLLNSGAALGAGHAFSIMGPSFQPGRTYNLRSDTDVGVRSITISQVRGGVL